MSAADFTCANPSPHRPILGCCGGAFPLAIKTFFAIHPWRGFTLTMGVNQINYCNRYLRSQMVCRNFNNGVAAGGETLTETIDRLGGRLNQTQAGTQLACDRFRVLRQSPFFTTTWSVSASSDTIFEITWRAVAGSTTETGTIRISVDTPYLMETWWADLMALYNGLPAFDEFEYVDGGQVLRENLYDQNGNPILIQPVGPITVVGPPALGCFEPVINPLSGNPGSSKILGGFSPLIHAAANGYTVPTANSPGLVKSSVRWGESYCRFKTATGEANFCQSLGDEGYLHDFFIVPLPPGTPQATVLVQQAPTCQPIDCTVHQAAGEVIFTPTFGGNGIPSVEQTVESMSPQSLPALPCTDCNLAP